MADRTANGRFAVGNRARTIAKAAASQPKGSDGVTTIGGFVISNERNPKLTGRQKWTSFDNATFNTWIVATAMRLWFALAGSVKWRADPNPRSKDPERGVAIVTEGLLEAQLSTSWRQIAQKQLMKCFRGFAMHATGIRTRKDGMVVFSDIQHRPQWTAYRWLKPLDDETQPWNAVEQMTRTGRTSVIPREELFYSVDNNMSESPEGVGLLRHVVELAEKRAVYAKLEGIGAQTDLNGMPVIRAPLQRLMDQAKSAGASTPDEIKAHVRAQLQFVYDFLEGHNKTDDQSLLFDSLPYLSQDEKQTPSAKDEWAIEVVRSAINIAPIGEAIHRIDTELANVMMAGWLMMGSRGTSGAYSAHGDKADLMAMAIDSANLDIAADTKRDLATRLIVLNGLDAEDDTPTVVPEPVARQDVEAVCRSLLALAQAGAPIKPGWKGVDAILSRMELPPEPETPEMALTLPRSPTPTPKPPADRKQPEAPAAGEGEPGNVNAMPATNKRRRKS